MKRIWAAFVLSVILSLVLTVCVIIDKRNTATSDVEMGKTIYIWTDEETGVQYVIYREKVGYTGFGGITPRLDPDGSLYCDETSNRSSSE